MSTAETGTERAASDECLWTIKQAAAYLQKSTSWTYREVEAGRLPHLRIGASVRFDPAALKAWACGETAKVLPLSMRR